MAVATKEGLGRIEELLGDDAESLLGHTLRDDRQEPAAPARARLRRPRRRRHRPRRTRCCATCSSMFDHGRLGGTGYLSILPVDQGIEHCAGASFAPNPAYFDPENDRRARDRGRLQRRRLDDRRARRRSSRKYAHRIPFIVKLNHNELLTYPNKLRPDDVRQRRAGLGDGRRRRRRDDLLRLRAEPPPDRRGQRGLRGGPRARDVHRALVLPAQPGVQDRTASTTTSPPT